MTSGVGTRSSLMPPVARPLFRSSPLTESLNRLTVLVCSQKWSLIWHVLIVYLCHGVTFFCGPQTHDGDPFTYVVSENSTLSQSFLSSVPVFSSIYKSPYAPSFEKANINLCTILMNIITFYGETYWIALF